MQLSAKGADAELTKDSIVSALGYIPAGGTYELINSVTMDAAAGAININRDSAGNAFSLSSAFVTIDLGKAQTINKVYFGNAQYSWAAICGQITLRYVACVLNRITDGLFHGYICTDGSVKEVDRKAVSNGILTADAPAIRQVSFFSYTDFPQGTVINLYGIKMI